MKAATSEALRTTFTDHPEQTKNMRIDSGRCAGADARLQRFSRDFRPLGWVCGDLSVTVYASQRTEPSRHLGHIVDERAGGAVTAGSDSGRSNLRR